MPVVWDSAPVRSSGRDERLGGRRSGVARAGSARRLVFAAGGLARGRGSAGVPEANAMVLATVAESGRPSARTVLMKGLDERGLVFYSNRTSRKGRELAANPRTTALFPWYPIRRQVIVEGSVSLARRGGLGRVLREPSLPLPDRRAGEQRVKRHRRARGARAGGRGAPAALPARSRGPRPQWWGGWLSSPTQSILAGPARPPARPPALSPRGRRLGHRATLAVGARATGDAGRASGARRVDPLRGHRPVHELERFKPSGSKQNTEVTGGVVELPRAG